MRLRTAAKAILGTIVATVAMSSGTAAACSPLEDATVDAIAAIQEGRIDGFEEHMVSEYGRPIAAIVEWFTYAETPGTARITRKSASAVTRSFGAPPSSTEDRIRGGLPIDDTDTCGTETGPAKGTYDYEVEFADGGTRRVLVPRDGVGAATEEAIDAFVTLAGTARVHAEPAALVAAAQVPPSPGDANPWLRPLGALVAALVVFGLVFGGLRLRSG